MRRPETSKRMVRRQLIQVQYLSHRAGDRWRAGHSIYPTDQPCCTTVVIDDTEVMVAVGWRNGAPLICRADDDELRHAHPTNPLAGSVIFDLTDGPVELEGPRARWRWRMVS